MPSTHGLCVNFVHDITQFNQQQWTELATDAGPFLRFDYVRAFESSECVGGDSGWYPAHIQVVNEQGQLIAIMPGYFKQDSYGEYVFDHGWANAYHEHGIHYYPKWISAVPYTPVTGPRLLCSPAFDQHTLASAITEFLTAQSHSLNLSSSHILFAPDTSTRTFEHANYLTRLSVQFEWHNYDFANFDDFLARFTSRKRKDIRKARTRLMDQNIHFRQLIGEQISPQDIEFFYHCYRMTYLKRSGHEGYLNLTFFKRIFASMADNTLLVIAEQAGEPVASALFFYDKTGLYGRYWGALNEIDGLHFETCYFQGIEFAIQKQLPRFNPGTQGEHKILRGFEPTYCRSFHQLYHPEFHAAVDRFLKEESKQIQRYFHQAWQAVPFNENVKASMAHNPNK